MDILCKDLIFLFYSWSQYKIYKNNNKRTYNKIKLHWNKNKRAFKSLTTHIP